MYIWVWEPRPCHWSKTDWLYLLLRKIVPEKSGERERKTTWRNYSELFQPYFLKHFSFKLWEILEIKNEMSCHNSNDKWYNLIKSMYKSLPIFQKRAPMMNESIKWRNRSLAMKVSFRFFLILSAQRTF